MNHEYLLDEEDLDEELLLPEEDLLRLVRRVRCFSLRRDFYFYFTFRYFSRCLSFSFYF